MKTAKFFGVGALALLLAGWGVAPALAQESAGASAAEEQAAPESSEATTVTVLERLPGAPQVDVYQVTCPGKTISISARICDVGGLDDAYIVSIVAVSPNTINVTNGDRGFILSSSAGGCTAFVFTVRPGGTQGLMKAYVSAAQSVGGAGNYELTINCNGPTTSIPAVKLLRDPD